MIAETIDEEIELLKQKYPGTDPVLLTKIAFKSKLDLAILGFGFILMLFLGFGLGYLFGKTTFL